MDELAAGLAQGRSQLAGDATDSGASATTGGRPEFAKWVEVATAVGRTNAAIICGRLESYQIPCRITQEAAGSSVLPVNVGVLAEAHVWVPEEYEAVAREILAEELDDEEE
jgi:hypothetical protein